MFPYGKHTRFHDITLY